MGEIIARTSCPVCGEPNQDVKINKNGNLYMYCDNRCSTRFNPKESRELLDQLRVGKTAKAKNLILIPVGVNVSTNNQLKEGNYGKFRGNKIDRRTDTGFAGSSGTGYGGRPRRGVIGWLLEDDEE